MTARQHTEIATLFEDEIRMIASCYWEASAYGRLNARQSDRASERRFVRGVRSGRAALGHWPLPMMSCGPDASGEHRVLRMPLPWLSAQGTHLPRARGC